MGETEKLVDLLERSFSGNSWHGPAVKEALAGIDGAKASARPIPTAHTIWELVLHIGGWTDVVRRRIEGEHLKEPQEGDFPPVADSSETGWQNTLKDLEARHNALKETIARKLDDPELGQLPYPGAKASSYVNLAGAAHHYIYHAGQIALLRKALE
ncbi:MAG TPA: DinB family protein [Blastocatellia bacterium]|nr:DinB family protein [Blastocatellia bacterium]